MGKIFVVLLLGVANLAGFAHFALVQHEQCPEHGDWMHVHAGAGHAVESPEATWHDRETADSHDHCSAPTALRDRLTQRHLCVVSRAVQVAVLQPAPQFAPAVVAREQATWRMAPKTSPPA